MISAKATLMVAPRYAEAHGLADEARHLRQQAQAETGNKKPGLRPAHCLQQFVDGRPVSQATEDYLSWVCAKLPREGNKALLLVWVVVCYLPSKSPWLSYTFGPFPEATS